MRKHTFLLLRLLVAGGLLVWLLARQDLSVIVELFRRVPLSSWGFAVAATWLGVVLSGARLLVVLRSVSIHVGLSTLSRICLGGVFVGNFLPSTVGGDALKFAYVRPFARRRLDVIIGILADRASGLGATLIVATIGAFWYRNAIVSESIFATVLALDAAFLATVAAAVRWQPREAEASTGSRVSLARLAGWIRDAHATLHTIARDARAAFGSLVLSLLFFCQVVLVVYVFSSGLGLSVGWGKLATITALVQLMTMVPVSFNGVGVREWGFVLFLSRLDVPTEAAVSLSLMIYFCVILASLPGALLLTEDTGRGARTYTDD